MPFLGVIWKLKIEAILASIEASCPQSSSYLDMSWIRHCIRCKSKYATDETEYSPVVNNILGNYNVHLMIKPRK